MGRPSKFSFQLLDITQSFVELTAEVSPLYVPVPDSTERSYVVASRVGQGRFRDESLRIWQTCCLSGFTKEQILIASHIKPWRVSNNRERLDGYNSLLLVPTYDRLFDKGYIGFDCNGRIALSDKIDMADARKVGLDDHVRLVKIPDQTMQYLRYHKEYIFDLVES